MKEIEHRINYNLKAYNTLRVSIRPSTSDIHFTSITKNPPHKEAVNLFPII